MKNKTGLFMLALFLSVFVFMVWAQERGFMFGQGSYDLQWQMVMIKIDNFVMGVAGAVVMLFAFVSLGFHFKLRRLQRELERVRQTTISELPK